MGWRKETRETPEKRRAVGTCVSVAVDTLMNHSGLRTEAWKKNRKDRDTLPCACRTQGGNSIIEAVSLVQGCYGVTTEGSFSLLSHGVAWREELYGVLLCSLLGFSDGVLQSSLGWPSSSSSPPVLASQVLGF